MDSGEALAGRYRLERRLGEGGMSVVWQAHDVVLRRDVAVKVLAAQRGIPQYAMHAEALAASRISHPHVASVYDYGETARGSAEPQAFLVMELLRGHSLKEQLVDGPVAARSAFRIAAEVASALAAAHAAQVVHRDVKPSNVMMTSTGAKVIDFGIAAPVGTVDDLAQENQILGTPAYLAPERVLRDVVESASDVYALGVLLYRMLTGHLPWSVSGAEEMLIEHLYGVPAPLPRAADVPAEVVRLYNLCVAKDPADRPSAGDAQVVLAAAADLPLGTARQESWSAGSVAAERIAPVRGAGDGPRRWDWTAALNGTRTPLTMTRPRSVAVPPVRDSASGTRRTVAYVVAAAAVLLGVLLLVGRPSGGVPTLAAPVPSVGLTPNVRTPTPHPANSNGQAPPRSATPGPVGQDGSAKLVGAASTPAGAPDGTASPAPTGTPTPSTSTSAGQTFTSSGGSVVAACDGKQAYLTSWEPAPSYEVGTVNAGPADKARAVFVSGTTKITMTVTCPDGAPEVSVKST